MADAARQLGLFDAPVEERKLAIEGAFDAYVAPLPGQPEPSGPLPVVASSIHECEQIAAVIAGVPEERVLCLPARSWDAELMDMLEGANRRAEIELVKLKQMHARILGCSVEELDQRMEAQKAAEQAARAEAKAARVVNKPPRASRAAAPAGEIKIGQRALSDRQRELLSHLKVENNLAIYVPKERIADWDELKRVMVALGGEWKRGSSRSPAGFSFPDDVDAAEVVRLARESGEILDARAAELFETPAVLADEMAAFIDPQPSDMILEPSAGRGRLVNAILRRCPDVDFICVEPFPASADLLESEGHRVIRADFLSLGAELEGAISHCILNPPFSKRADVAHISRAIELLPVGGRLAAIASAGVKYRDDKLAREFRAEVERHGGTITDNPPNSFAASGTGVNTIMLRMVKRG